jgi:predicted phosphohydrolase
MKIVMISDTHNRHDDLDIPEGDMILHAGDFTGMGTARELKDFVHWYSKLPHKYKVVIAGNHDWGMDGQNQIGYERFCERRYYGGNKELKEIEKEVRSLMKSKGIIYLKDSSIIIEGIKIYGSPVQPEFCGWAFNKYRGAEIQAEWANIPVDTNILITHGPPHNIGDKCQDGFRAGCKDLSERIKQLPDLKLHVFGHIHEDQGITEIKENGKRITYVNASSLNLSYRPQAKHAFVVDYEDL